MASTELYPITIDIGTTSAPIFSSSSVMCPGLNVEYLGGLRASAFAPISHTHDASAIVSGVLAANRVALGTPLTRMVPAHDGTTQIWRQLTTQDLPDVSAFGRSLVGLGTAPDVRSYIDAAATDHYHHASRINAGILSMDRLGSYTGSPSSSYVLAVGSIGGSSQWKQLGFADISNAVGIGLPPTSGRVAMWSGPSTISDAPVSAGGGFVGIVAGYGLAVADDSFYINGVKLPKPPSNGQLYGIRANGGGSTAWETIPTGAAGPTSPANAVFVWVVNGTATGGSWYQLTGDNVYTA